MTLPVLQDCSLIFARIFISIMLHQPPNVFPCERALHSLTDPPHKILLSFLPPISASPHFPVYFTLVFHPAWTDVLLCFHASHTCKQPPCCLTCVSSCSAQLISVNLLGKLFLSLCLGCSSVSRYISLLPIMKAWIVLKLSSLLNFLSSFHVFYHLSVPSLSVS